MHQKKHISYIYSFPQDHPPFSTHIMVLQILQIVRETLGSCIQQDMRKATSNFTGRIFSRQHCFAGIGTGKGFHNPTEKFKNSRNAFEKGHQIENIYHCTTRMHVVQSDPCPQKFNHQTHCITHFSPKRHRIPSDRSGICLDTAVNWIDWSIKDLSSAIPPLAPRSHNQNPNKSASNAISHNQNLR